jgi:hypothetical protein
MKMEQTECSETSAYKILTAGNYPEEGIKHSERGESLKSRKMKIFWDEACSSVGRRKRFGGICCLLLHETKIIVLQVGGKGHKK